MSVPRIVTGLELVDDEGDEVIVGAIDHVLGIVTLETDEDSYSMSLRELRGKLRDGEFAVLDADQDDEGDADDERTS
jgi:hypothetical protein